MLLYKIMYYFINVELDIIFDNFLYTVALVKFINLYNLQFLTLENLAHVYIIFIRLRQVLQT